ncbi:MAG: alanine racemase [Coriobacteriales bacterium]|jgi:alanine racemase|nr:alanine racemase [Coriobacteriales bacterium]
MNEQISIDYAGMLPPFERRWAWTEIDRDAIRANLKNMRKLLGPDVIILTVVKADAYGHGAVEVAKAALGAGSKYIGVANVTEGMQLRRAGIKAPIIILSEPPATCVDAILSYDLVPTICTVEFALALGEAASAAGVIAPFHLKVDTGMNRIGVHYTDAGDFLRTVSFHEGLELQGTFTHFATADTADSYAFKTQMDRFEHALETIRYMGMEPGIVHAANSAAAIRYKSSHFDMVRLGIATYGLHPSNLTRDLVQLEPAMSIHARICALKQVGLGEGVSYGYTYRSPGGVEIATIPLGYGDGLSRLLSNKMDVLVEGHRYPQVGTICMDMCMFEVRNRKDISSLRNAQLSAERKPVEYGDKVTIVGKSGNQEISMDDLANRIGTINYDMACMFGRRLERYYVN